MRPALDVVTYNLMGLADERLDERTEAICQSLLLEDPPDVVLLQEVVPRTLAAHVLPHFSAAGFTVAPRQPVSESSYFCTIAVRSGLAPKAAWRRPFPGSQMGRALLCLEVDWAGETLRVCTSHLESLRQGQRERAAQIASVADALREATGPAVFGGDTNARTDHLEGLGPDIQDAWDLAGRPASAAATWWPLRGKGPRRRFDRVWLGGRGRWAVEQMQTLPAARVAGMRVSDHVGVRVRLTWQAGLGTVRGEEGESTCPR